MKVREEIPEKYTWDLTPIFESTEAFERAYEEIDPLLQRRFPM